MHTCYAIVHKDEDSAFGISFPDLPSVFSAADNEDEIVANAIEALSLWAEDMELPRPSTLDIVRARAEVREAGVLRSCASKADDFASTAVL